MRYLFYFSLVLSLFSCKNNSNEEIITTFPKNITIPKGMVWIPGNTFTMGAKDNDNLALPHEKPAHSVTVDGFFMDETEVTNAQFRKFIEATGYLTTAERPINWEEMKKTLPEGTPKPHDSILAPGSLVFYEEIKSVSGLNNWQQWWKWTLGANWRHPYGPNSNINGKDNYPVVHISYEDALAYCKWANRKLPSEAQWELAAMGNLKNAIYTWGDDKNKLDKKANTWQGSFPIQNAKVDGYNLLSPVKSFQPNSLGLFEMSGNVWEYTSDWYNTDYYQELFNTGITTKNPNGASTSKNPNNPYQAEKIIKGGSFLCNENYCSSFRISARMGMTEDSSSDHVGFRTIATIEMLQK
ncbi:SUMF1/EgtB/PvdO family nonheme iron enzyme [Flavobacterium sp. LMO8]|uniref:formylglycine-generating enzyme family protein n=1 Tax=Flavobacterium sp. LMO8 TaxID=2654244 RepID=UPI0012924F99|nr:formylglycine-generating enzyme family protein [Flavobacterium sp. LMO8]MQP25652.1 SUMF1/EgtB/PvdO family nonheme iron enzyme [Flavobacterium sp. LMO8]